MGKPLERWVRIMEDTEISGMVYNNTISNLLQVFQKRYEEGQDSLA